VCYLAYEGLRLSALSSFVGLRKIDLAMRGAPAMPEQRLAALRAHISAAGVDPSFVDNPDCGIPAAFGRVKFAFNGDVSALRTVLVAVDQFITLADGPMPSPFMQYSPLPAFRRRRIGRPASRTPEKRLRTGLRSLASRSGTSCRWMRGTVLGVGRLSRRQRLHRLGARAV
jgi:hypothetical protein